MTDKITPNTGMTNLADLEKLTTPNVFKSNIDLGSIPKFNKHGDNIEPIIRNIPIHSIDEYAFNPRQADNNHFESIKESIFEIGLQQRFSVVKNPETKRYTLIKGGNTRLLAFKTLYRETGDTKFASIDCIVEPWDGELNKTQAVIAHLIENEARGELILVDKAKALIQLEQDFRDNLNIKKESEESSDSQKDNNYKNKQTKPFVDYLKNNGYSVSEGQLGLFRFAATRLTGNLDNFLNQGLGSPQIIKIRVVYNNLRRILKENKSSLETLDGDFSSALKKYNKSRKPFEFEKLLKVLIDHLITIEPFIDIFSNNTAKFKEELLSATRKPKAKKAVNEIIDNVEDSKIAEASAFKVKAETQPVGINTEQSYEQPIPVPTSPVEPINTESILVGSDIPEQVSEKTEGEATVRLDLYRKQAISLAMKITNKLNIGKTIEQIDTGCGFLLVDLVDESKNDFEHWGIWWELLACSHAADLLNPISSETINKIEKNKHLNVELLTLYSNVSKSDAKFVDIALQQIHSVSGLYEFRPPNLQSVKDRMVPHMWQDITELEFVSYQIMRIVSTGEADSNLTLWN